MDTYDKIMTFKTEIDQITDKRLRNLTVEFLINEVPEYFWEVAASISGKYHPAFALGEGGLTRHTKAVTQLAIEQVALYDDFIQDLTIETFKDIVIVASLLHDSFKYGDDDDFLDPELQELSFKQHGQLAGDQWRLFCETNAYYDSVTSRIRTAMACHMSKWGGDKAYTEMPDYARVVSMADYVASRKIIDFPEISVDIK